MPIVLIELPGGEGVVRRDDGEIVVTQDVRDDRGHPLRVEDRRGRSSDRVVAGDCRALAQNRGSTSLRP